MRLKCTAYVHGFVMSHLRFMFVFRFCIVFNKISLLLSAMGCFGRKEFAILRLDLFRPSS